ncbi:putative MICOS complex subunit Mic10 protein [Helianthus annuus]|nr:putative MICOS complex subunit Mic10 protein [Helianthus annuus]
MAESKEIYDVNAKWDAYLDVGVRRFVYSSATGLLAGFLLFRQFPIQTLPSFLPLYILYY